MTAVPPQPDANSRRRLHRCLSIDALVGHLDVGELCHVREGLDGFELLKVLTDRRRGVVAPPARHGQAAVAGSVQIRVLELDVHPPAQNVLPVQYMETM